MTVNLFKLDEHPNRVAVSKIDFFVDGGSFFLDFSRPIQTGRWFIVANRWAGFAINLLVPVVHQGEEHGGYVIGIHRSDPSFANIRTLWKKHYPSIEVPMSGKTNGLRIIEDFATQFPNDSQ
ncbi:MAG: hypothetical protein WCD07_08880 [Burkholderiales bacterium]